MIYTDLDNTLIDAVVRMKVEMAVAQKYGINEANYRRAIDIAFAKQGIGNFGYNALFEACREIKPDFSDEARNDWQRVMTTPHMFSDALFFLKCFSREDLVLLTTGSFGFQLAKIETHNLEQYFFEIKIVGSPKSKHFVPSSGLNFFVDDSPREIDAMKIAHPSMRCVMVREPAPWEKQKVSYSADVRCADLLEARDYILDQCKKAS